MTPTAHAQLSLPHMPATALVRAAKRSRASRRRTANTSRAVPRCSEFVGLGEFDSACTFVID